MIIKVEIQEFQGYHQIVVMFEGRGHVNTCGASDRSILEAYLRDGIVDLALAARKLNDHIKRVETGARIRGAEYSGVVAY